MSVWVVIVVVVPVLLVVALRLWFRWFSHRPLTSADQYAVAVDTAVDGADPRSRPLPPSRPDRVTTPAPPAIPSPLVTPGKSDGRPAFVASGPAATAWAQPGQRYIPQQRTATDDRAVAEGHAAAPPAPPAGRPADR